MWNYVLFEFKLKFYQKGIGCAHIKPRFPFGRFKMEEIWKDIHEYEGLYQVSNTGKVKSVSHYTRNNRNGGLRMTVGKILSQYKMPNGYRQVQLSKNERREKKYVHRLVAENFIQNVNNLSDVNHIDGNKDNNSISNLEWCSHKDNQKHMIENHMTKKATPVICNETGKMYHSMSEAEKDTGICRRTIKKLCASGETFKGLSWRFCYE